ncbi:MAG: type II secretion system protein GspJ, partial [Planctomycetes bacterium]|nr:type II secretion system protein GspJ [Planctomycetota bacterium]
MDAKSQFPRRSHITSRISVRNGVSLLELLLALALSTVVMGLIAMSINLNFRMYDTKRTSIEEAKLARSVLRHIADDIRAAVQHMPPDLSGLETVIGNSTNAQSALGGAAGLGALAGAAGQTGGATGGGSGQAGAQGGSGAQTGQQGGTQNGTGGGTQTGTGGGGQNGTGNGLPTTTSTTTGGVDAQTAEAGSIYGEEQAGGVIGVYGSSSELQIDISRLPRVDQFQAMADPNNLSEVVDIPSDMKTVSYFLRPEEGMTEVGPDGRGRGLMRRVLDRSVSNFEMQNGGTGSLGQLDVMAEEVVGLQFMYFDGSTWTSDWDSASMEGLPVAIEITVILKSLADQRAENSASSLTTTTEEDNERLYTLTVNLPTAVTAEEKQMAADEKAAAE